MPCSVFDLFKIGIGPSSSHTVGPMVAAARFVDDLKAGGNFDKVARVRTSLHGSLAFTGKGHASDVAILLGLSGERPDSVDPDAVEGILAGIQEAKRIRLGGGREIPFDQQTDLVFDFDERLPGHSNGMRISAYDGSGGELATEVYYSIGGGFVVTEAELGQSGASDAGEDAQPFRFETAAQMLSMAEESGLTIAEMMMRNELAGRSDQEVVEGLDKIWGAMHACIERGLKGEGELPGGLKVRRRAKKLLESIDAETRSNVKMPHACMDWVSLFALAVNEENAAGGRVVTAPTNGAAGIIPAVVCYYKDFCDGADEQGIRDFLLTAAAIGALIKRNASISGAEAGCQGEVGSACAMAAGGLAAALGGSNEQIENAAEIGLEHNLGLTCDPVGGLVQVPCIERNAMAANKAINAASLALKGDGKHIVSLDVAVETMRQTGVDMQSKYKETSQGGLAVNVVEC